MAQKQVDGGRSSDEGTLDRDIDTNNGGAEVENGEGRHDKSGGKETEDPLFNLGKALAATKDEPEEFSFGGSADFLPPVPGLFIEGFGKVALPLIDEQQADKIVKVCEPTPSEPELDTHVDMSMRSCWQLDSSKVKLQHPGWVAGIQKAESFIAEKFGVAGTPITLHLHTLLLQKADGALGKCYDTEKEDRSFATMIIQLPSAHKGGQLQVFKDGSEDPVIHDFGAAAGTAEYQCNYAVHCADAEHTVQLITEGYRLALVYSVCWPANSTHSATSFSREEQAPMLKALAELADANREFHYYLEHSYSTKCISELGVGSLKGQDRARVANLRTANAALPPHQRFKFYLLHGRRHSSFYGSGSSYDCEWEVASSPSSKFTSLLSLDGKSLTSSAITLDDADVLNPDDKTRLQRWSGHRTTTYEGNLGNEGPTEEFTYVKYLLLAWPAKVAEDKMIALIGVYAYFKSLLSAGASPETMRKFMQRVVAMKAAGQVDADKENEFGQALYKHIASVPKLNDLLPVYFDIFPLGTHIPEPPLPTYCYSMYENVPDPTTPFIDIIQMIQQPRFWETLGEKVVNAFAGKTLLTLDLLKQVRISTVPETKTKNQLMKKLIELFRHPVTVTTDMNAPWNQDLQEQLWSAVLASEGSETFEDLACAYVAHFPQGAYAKSWSHREGRFSDLLILATTASVWKAISRTALKGFKADMEGALVFVQLCKQRLLPRMVWLPFLNIAFKICEASAPSPHPGMTSDLKQIRYPYWFSSGDSKLSETPLSKALCVTAMMLDDKSDSEIAAKLLTHYITMRMGIISFTHIIVVARRFPSAWKASKNEVLRAMGSDMKVSLSFIKKCRSANLPEAVWGPSVDVCTKIIETPTDKELGDSFFQSELWHTAIDLPTPNLCQTSVTRYMAAPLASTAVASSALLTVCKEDSRAFEEKRTVLEPLLLHWFRALEKDLRAMEKKCKKVGAWYSSGPTITGHPSLAGFSKSSDKSLRIQGFTGIAEARNCADGITFKNYKGAAEAGGRGSDSYVEVTHNPKYAQELEEKRSVIKAECDSFRELLPQLDEGGPSKKRRVEKA